MTGSQGPWITKRKEKVLPRTEFTLWNQQRGLPIKNGKNQAKGIWNLPGQKYRPRASSWQHNKLHHITMHWKASIEQLNIISHLGKAMVTIAMQSKFESGLRGNAQASNSDTSPHRDGQTYIYPLSHQGIWGILLYHIISDHKSFNQLPAGRLRWYKKLRWTTSWASLAVSNNLHPSADNTHKM